MSSAKSSTFDTADVTIFINLLLGLIPVMTLAWSVAGDERKSAGERVVESESDRQQQLTIFSMICGLWLPTLGMWNWMRGESRVWIILWCILGLICLVLSWFLRKRRMRSSLS